MKIVNLVECTFSTEDFVRCCATGWAPMGESLEVAVRIFVHTDAATDLT